MNNFAKKVLQAKQGKTHIFSIGQAGFIIKNKDGHLLGVDLYLSDCVERIEGHIGYHRLIPQMLSPSELEFDVIIATHPHKDHFDDDAIPFLLSNGHTHLFASVDCENDIKRLNLEKANISYVSPGMRCSTEGFELDFINCDHGTGAPDAVGVIITVDKKRILIVGDSSLRLDRKDEYLKNGIIDVMIAPINGAYGNLNEIECATLAGALSPLLTIPSHYGMFASHGGDPWKFCKQMHCNYPELNFKLMCPGEEIIL